MARSYIDCILTITRTQPANRESLTVLQQAISVINGKGGTGKTSIVANLAGLFAAADYRILAVDLDPQGNLGRDLGYLEVSDAGQSLFSAVMTPGATPLVPLRDVRPGL